MSSITIAITKGFAFIDTPEGQVVSIEVIKYRDGVDGEQGMQGIQGDQGIPGEDAVLPANLAYTDVDNDFTETQTLKSATTTSKSWATKWIYNGDDYIGTINGKGGRFLFVLRNDTQASEVEFIVDESGAIISNNADLGTVASKFKELFLSSYANVLGVKSVENDAAKVFATDGSVQSLSSGLTDSEIYEMRCNFNNAVAEQLPFIQTAYDSATTESLMLIPSGFKAGGLVSQLPKTGVGDFTVARNCVKTRINESGDRETLAIDKPSIDYSDGDGVLLLEPQSTNLYLNSAILVTQNITTLASDYTVSFYGTGTVTFTGTYAGSLVGTGATDRVSLTFTATAGTLTSTVTGTVTDGQAENLGYSTSYIKTEGATVTRLKDEVENAGDETTFNSESGVLYARIKKKDSTTSQMYISISDDSNNNRVTIRTRAFDTVRAEIVIGGVSGLISDFAQDTSIVTDIAIAWGQNVLELWINGVKIIESAAFGTFTPNTLNKLHLSNGNGIDQPFRGEVHILKTFKGTLTDVQKAELTTDGYITTL